MISACRPAVSVIVPAYNAQTYIGDALASVASQTLSDWEVLVVDDASTDDTREIVATISSHDPRVTLVSADKNLGPAGARNLAITRARGHWIAMLDADDMFASTRLATLLDNANNNKADIVVDWLRCINEDGTDDAFAREYARDAVRTQLTVSRFLKSDWPGRKGKSWGFLQPFCRRRFLDESGVRYQTRIRIGEDLVFAVECLMAGARMFVEPQPLYLYRQTKGSLSRRGERSTYDQLVDNNNYLLRRAVSLGRDDWAEVLRERGKALSVHAVYQHIADLVKSKQYRSAFRLWAMHMEHSPALTAIFGARLSKRVRKYARAETK